MTQRCFYRPARILTYWRAKVYTPLAALGSVLAAVTVQGGRLASWLAGERLAGDRLAQASSRG